VPAAAPVLGVPGMTAGPAAGALPGMTAGRGGVSKVCAEALADSDATIDRTSNFFFIASS
jgi:hypothetical protein